MQELARKKRRNHLAKYWQLYAMMVLPIIYFIIFKYIPMFGNVLAFRRFRPGMSQFGTEWRGLMYFDMFLNDSAFHKAFINTIVLSLSNLLINFPIPIIFAILVNEISHKYLKKFTQTISYMPRFVSTVVVISMLREMLSPSFGLVNKMLGEWFGMTPIHFIDEPQYFRVIYILTDMWQYTGWTAIIYLAAITGINSELYEAAAIDGANKWNQITKITVPSILPTVMVMLILSVGRLLSLGFEKVLLLYSTNNSSVSDIIDTFVYRIGLIQQNYSYATAVGLFGGLIGIILVAGSNAISRKLTGEGVY